MSFPAVILAQAKKAGVTSGSLERQGVTKYCVKTASTPRVSHREAGSLPLEGHLGAQEPTPLLHASSQAPTDEAITAWGNGKGYQ